MRSSGSASTRRRSPIWSACGSRRADVGLAGRLPLHRGCLGLRRGGGATSPYSPMLVVEASFAEAVVLETVVLSVLNHDSAVASAASRMTSAAGDSAMHRDGFPSYPRVGRCGGGSSGLRGRISRRRATSRRAAAYGVPTRGTAHTRSPCCTTTSGMRSLPKSPRSAKAPRCWWTPTTSAWQSVLGVEVAGPGLGAVRLDSGDLRSWLCGSRSSWTPWARFAPRCR